MSAGQCRKRYPGSDRPGDRSVVCDLPADHLPERDHEETETGATWPEPPPVEGSRAWLEAKAAGRHPDTVHLIRLFAWSHLTPHLADVSRPVGLLVLEMLDRLKDGPELTAGLRKLREAKDCFVTQALE